MQISIDVENIKCGGCANSISKQLKEDQRISSVAIDINNGRVTLESEHASVRENAVAALLKMGYPEKDSVSGLQSIKAKANSFVSCAVGRISPDES